MAVDPNQGFLVSGGALQKIQTGLNDIASLKQQVKQVQSQYLPGLPNEIFVPRSGPVDGIYTGDVYIKEPVSGSYAKMLENQTAELMPDEIAP